MTTEASGGALSFRRKFAAGQIVVGTFIKTPTIHATEILGDIGFDFVVIDEEHAPFDSQTTDLALFAARSVGVAGLVRVSSDDPSNILRVLDCGATGVLVPHVTSVEKARNIASSCRYRGGRRGYSASGRAGRYGASKVWAHVDAQDSQTTVIAMIEDPEAVENIDAIAAVEGIDGFFIGRGDLTVAYGASASDAPEIIEAVSRIIKAARAVGKPVCVMVRAVDEAKGFHGMGATAFIVSTDQGFMRAAATKTLNEFAAAIPRSAE